MDQMRIFANIFGELIIGNLFVPIDDIFVLVHWPEVQEYMEHDWFDKECISYEALDGDEDFSAAHLVPLRRMLQINGPG
ncbi:MAG: hypothetical protein JST32_17010 [Bacteroidetes bacterium]|nr:hypothetical protein [Bacteroidota bacterium]